MLSLNIQKKRLLHRTHIIALWVLVAEVPDLSTHTLLLRYGNIVVFPGLKHQLHFESLLREHVFQLI